MTNATGRRDLRPLFDAEPSGVLFTRDILARLIRDETRPWPEWKAGKPLTETQLARLVKPYRIAPKTVRRGVDTGKGYRREWFDVAFRRYLPPEAVTPSQPSDSAAFGDIPAVTNPAHVTAPATVKLSVSAGCDGVTAKAAKQDGWSLEL